MGSKGKRKLSPNELSPSQLESRSSRGKSLDAKPTPNTPTRTKRKRNNDIEEERPSKIIQDERAGGQEMDQLASPNISSAQSNMSLADRISLLLPKELERDDSFDSSETSASSPENTIPATIERPPLPWADESDHDSSEGEEDDMNWEAVAETELEKPTLDSSTSNQVIKDIEITFETPKSKNRKSKFELEIERIVRDLLHNAHVVCLVGHYMLRNKWCSRADIKSLCKSVIPEHTLSIIESSGSDIKGCIRAISSWWRSYFEVTSLGISTHTFDEFESLDEETRLLLYQGLSSMPAEKKSILKSVFGGDFIRTSKEFIECLVAKKGSRDTSSQLFVTILRSVGIDARLVCSLQPVSYRVAADRSDDSRSNKATGRSGNAGTSHRASGDDGSKQPIKYPFRTPAPRLSPPPDEGTSRQKASKASSAPSSKPPTVWAEVYDSRNCRWLSVDPIRGYIDDAKAMEPSVSSKQNVLSYVLAFDADCDGCVDVTRRYTSHWEKTNRLRGRELSKSEKEIGRRPWWDEFYETVRRRKMGERERDEEDEFETLGEKEPIPTSISRFNNHRLYALERHLKKFEILEPNATVLGKIKGENIYPRSAVQSVSTAETWLKQGRSIKAGEQPIKTVNARAVTLERKRAKEIARQEGEDLQVGCYAYWQTEKYKPQKVINGAIPKNSFGNVDLYQPDMCPIGATHIPIQGIAKIARKLGIDFGEAVVGFEFVKQRSVPIINGIVVPAEAEEMVLEAWQETQAHESRKALAKQEVDIYQRWKRLITSALMQERLKETYGH